MKKPDITPIQIVAFLIGGIPNLVVLFGLDLSSDQQDALIALTALAGSLIFGDGAIRVGRAFGPGRAQAQAETMDRLNEAQWADEDVNKAVERQES